MEKIEKYLNFKNLAILLVVLPIWVGSFVDLYEDRQKIQDKIRKTFLPQTTT